MKGMPVSQTGLQAPDASGKRFFKIVIFLLHIDGTPQIHAQHASLSTLGRHAVFAYHRKSWFNASHIDLTNHHIAPLVCGRR
jgi:hypothetical protein